MAFIAAQNNSASIFKEIPTFRIDSKPDSVKWEVYDSLSDQVFKYDSQQRIKAWNTADSMSKIEYPCYEFFVEFQDNNSLANNTIDSIQWNMPWSSTAVNFIQCKWVIQKRKRSKLKSTGSVICNDDYRE